MRPVKSRQTPEKAEQLWEAHRPLAGSLAVRYARKWSRVSLKELLQDAMIACWNAARLWDARRTGPFGAHARRVILQAIWHHVNRHSYPPVREISLDDVVRGNDSDEEPITLFDKIEYEKANAELNDHAAENQERVMAVIRHLIDTVLTPRERQIMRLRLSGLDNNQIHQHVPGNIGMEAGCAIRKLRAAMIELGYRALPPEAKLPTGGFGRPAPERPRR